MESCIFSTKNLVRDVKLGSLMTATARHACSTTAVCRAFVRMHLVWCRPQEHMKTANAGKQLMSVVIIMGAFIFSTQGVSHSGSGRRWCCQGQRTIEPTQDSLLRSMILVYRGYGSNVCHDFLTFRAPVL